MLLKTYNKKKSYFNGWGSNSGKTVETLFIKFFVWELRKMTQYLAEPVIYEECS